MEEVLSFSTEKLLRFVIALEGILQDTPDKLAEVKALHGKIVKDIEHLSSHPIKEQS